MIDRNSHLRQGIVAVSGHQDAPCRIVEILQPLGTFGTAPVGQADVDQCEIEPFGPRNRYTGVAGVGHAGVMAEKLEHFRHTVGEIEIVIDDKNFHGRISPHKTANPRPVAGLRFALSGWLAPGAVLDCPIASRTGFLYGPRLAAMCTSYNHKPLLKPTVPRIIARTFIHKICMAIGQWFQCESAVFPAQAQTMPEILR
jgi:hypothetical protein